MNGENKFAHVCTLTEQIARMCAEFDGTTLPSWREYVRDRIMPLIEAMYAESEANR